MTPRTFAVLAPLMGMSLVGIAFVGETYFYDLPHAAAAAAIAATAWLVVLVYAAKRVKPGPINTPGPGEVNHYLAVLSVAITSSCLSTAVFFSASTTIAVLIFLAFVALVMFVDICFDQEAPESSAGYEFAAPWLLGPVAVFGGFGFYYWGFEVAGVLFYIACMVLQATLAYRAFASRPERGHVAV